MPITEWDPLLASTETNQDFVLAAKKREILNILKSYVGAYDPFAELVQNAMDAVDERQKELQEGEYRKRIWIEVNLKENRVSVTDNGIGFNEDKLKAFLSPNISFKPGASSRGCKGVGATYLAYGFNYLEFGTKTPEFSAVAALIDGRKWVEDTSNTIPRPKARAAALTHQVFESVDRGSTFTLR